MTGVQTCALPISNTKKESENISFLCEEIKTLEYIKDMLPTENILFKKTTRYVYMHLLGSQHKWICRIAVQQDKNLLTLHKFDTTDYETEYYFDELSQYLQLKNKKLICFLKTHHFKKEEKPCSKKKKKFVVFVIQMKGIKKSEKV